MSESTISVSTPEALIALLGTRDQHVRKISDAVPVDIYTQDGDIHITGAEPAVMQATEIFEQLKGLLGRQGSLDPEHVSEAITRVTAPMSGKDAVDYPIIDIGNPSRQMRPRTPGQARFVKAIRNHDLTFCIGPAGTGKTYLAVALAVEALRQKQVRKIVMARPAVEAGESLGFLPGDLQAKIHPYLRPLLDSLRDMMDYEQVKRFTDDDVIEMVPLAYMRGRTLNDAFIILDEAQNATTTQMKMFLTRMGLRSKVVVSGDTTQVDLPDSSRSGLADALARLKNIRGVTEVQLSNSDIVRHRLVQDIVRAYEEGPKRKS